MNSYYAQKLFFKPDCKKLGQPGSAANKPLMPFAGHQELKRKIERSNEAKISQKSLSELGEGMKFSALPKICGPMC
jgi:hypothetical protein